MITVISHTQRGTGAALARVLSRLPGEGVVNWTGGNLTPDPYDPVSVLNAHARTDKLWQLSKLLEGGVPVPAFYRRGNPNTPHDWGQGRWWPRTRFHQQGRDFTGPIRPDYWVRRLPLEDEWRLHFFKTKKGNLKLLRSGLKLPKNLRAHPWVKSHRLGWKISYIGGAPSSLVEYGRKAMEVLDLDFGAVDCALTVSAAPVVLEVNTCPGLEGGTLGLYVEAIKERLS